MPVMGKGTPEQLLQVALANKEARRRRMARMSLDQKLCLMVELQRLQAMADELAGRKPRKPWDLSWCKT